MRSFFNLIVFLCLLLHTERITGSPFDAGDIGVVWSLKPQKNASIPDLERRKAIVKDLNNSFVRINDRDLHQIHQRHEYTIQSLDDSSIKLKVPRKKLRHLPTITVYDYTNSSTDLMIQKFEELIQNPRNHVMVAPHPWGNLSELIKETGYQYNNRCVHFMRDRDYSGYFPLLDTDFSFKAMGVSAFTSLMKTLRLKISSEEWDSLNGRVKRWARTQRDSEYYIQTLQMRFAGDDRFCLNGILASKVLQYLRIDKDAMTRIFRAFGAPTLFYWIDLCHPEHYSKRQHLHILWKWNDFPDHNYVELNPRDVFWMRGNTTEIADSVLHLNTNFLDGVQPAVDMEFPLWFLDVLRQHISITSDDVDLLPKGHETQEE